MEKNNKYQGRIGKKFKSLDLNVKEIELDSEKRTISGYAAIFGNVDKSGDVLVKGCFSKSIQDRGPESSANDKIIMLWMHDMDEPIARVTVLKEDDKGLYFEAKVDDVDKGNQALKQLESGTLNQFSIGYRYVWENCEWDDDKRCLIVKEVVLYEISVVSIGCNGDTEYLGLKGESDYLEKYNELVVEINSLCKGMSARKQQELQRIIAKSMSLASARPENNPPKVEEAGSGSKKSMFDNLLIKKI